MKAQGRNFSLISEWEVAGLPLSSQSGFAVAVITDNVDQVCEGISFFQQFSATSETSLQKICRTFWCEF